MATCTDLENYEITELKKYSITQLEETFATAIASTSRRVHRFLFFNSIDRTNLVKQFQSIPLSAKDVVAPQARVDLINTTGFWNDLYGDPTNVNKAVLLKLGLPAKKTLFTGTGEDIALKDAEGTLTIRSSLYAILQQTVGSDDTPITYGAELLTDGGLETWTDNVTLTNWTDGVGGDPNIIQEGTQQRTGTWCCKILGNAGGDLNYIQQAAIAVTAGHCYHFEFWHQWDAAETNQHPKYHIIDDNNKYLQADGSWGVGAYSFSVTSTADWQKEYKSFVVDSAAATLTVRIGNRVVTGDDILIDDVALNDGNPATITWNLLIDKGFDSTFSTSNTDIDFTNWDIWGDDCALVELYLNASFTGEEKIVDILKRIAELSSSYIWEGRDGLLTFKRLKSGGTSSLSVTSTMFKSFKQEIKKTNLMNSIEVFYDYDGADWAGSVTDTSAASIASWGTYFKQIQYTNIWHETSASATSMADKEIIIKSKPSKYITVTGMLELSNLELGQLAKVTLPLVGTTDQMSRLEKINDKSLIDGTLELTLKDMSSENFLFSVDSYGEFANGTAGTNIKLGEGYAILKRNAGAYGTFTSLTKTASSTGYITMKIEVYDKNDVLLASHIYTSGSDKTHVFDISDCLAGDDYTVKRILSSTGFFDQTTIANTGEENIQIEQKSNAANAFQAANIQYKDYAASGTYTSECYFWEDTVQYGSADTSTVIAGADTLTLRIGASTDACSSDDDLWPAAAAQALANGEETWDISADSGDALDDSNYVHFTAVLGSNDGSTSPKLQYVKIYPE